MGTQHAGQHIARAGRGQARVSRGVDGGHAPRPGHHAARTLEPAKTMSKATTSSNPGSGRTQAIHAPAIAVGSASARERNSMVESVTSLALQRCHTLRAITTEITSIAPFAVDMDAPRIPMNTSTPIQ